MNATPSMDPADQGSMAGTLRHVFRKMMMNVDGMLPATVIAYDRATNQARVQPQVMMLSTTGERMARGQIDGIDVLNIGGGGFVLSFPLKPGDLGWILASDRDISLFRQSLAAAAPNTERIHSFSDGLFIPDILRTWTLSGEDAESMVLQTVDASQRISVSPSGIKMTGTLLDLNFPAITSTAATFTLPNAIVTAKQFVEG